MEEHIKVPKGDDHVWKPQLGGENEGERVGTRIKGIKTWRIVFEKVWMGTLKVFGCSAFSYLINGWMSSKRTMVPFWLLDPHQHWSPTLRASGCHWAELSSPRWSWKTKRPTKTRSTCSWLSIVCTLGLSEYGMFILFARIYYKFLCH